MTGLPDLPEGTLANAVKDLILLAEDGPVRFLIIQFGLLSGLGELLFLH